MPTQQPYTYRPNPILTRSFLIMKRDDDGDLSPIGDYTLLDWNERPDITEKKVMNLISLMNGEKQLINLGDETGTRLLFHRKPQETPEDPAQIVFFTYDAQSVSRENAILTLERESPLWQR